MPTALSEQHPATVQTAVPPTMQAIVFDDFGGPEVLVAREVPTPEVRPHDLLVRNASIGVNRADLLHRKGAYGRAYFGDADTMGLEIAGTVVAVGPLVRGFAVGDRVMGIVGGGAYAELSRIEAQFVQNRLRQLRRQRLRCRPAWRRRTRCSSSATSLPSSSAKAW